METTKNKLSPYATTFFNKLGNYLDTKLYFYGSIQRDDYFTNDSDLDVAIFTDNTSSMLSKMINYFNIKKYEFKKFVWKLNITKNVVSGQKYMYIEPENNFKVEFCIYDEKFKNDLLLEYDDKIQIPFHATILLILLKIIYYKLGLITREWYSYLKGKILTVLCGKPVNHFVIVDITE
jgi:predicted nucleotidyltransferase